MEAKSKRRGDGRIAFLARLDAIRAEVEAGRTLVMIYDRLQMSGAISYSQFARYAAQYISPRFPAPPSREGEAAREGQVSVPAPHSRAVPPPPVSPPDVPAPATSPNPGAEATGLDREVLNDITASKINLTELALIHHQQRSKK